MWGRRTSMLGWQQQQQPSKGCPCPRKEKRINVWVKTGSPVFSIRPWTRRDHSYRRVSRDGVIMMMGDWLLIWRGSQQVNILRIMETKWITVGESSYTYKKKEKTRTNSVVWNWNCNYWRWVLIFNMCRL